MTAAAPAASAVGMRAAREAGTNRALRTTGCHRIGVLAHGGHRGHARREGIAAGRRQQRRQRAGRAVHLAPAGACLQLRVRPDAGHVVHAGVGDLRVFQPLGDLRDGQVGKGRHDQVAQGVAVGGALRIRQEARVFGQVCLA
ncbi:hypothetical protein G6F22_020213 [Rhizopus arrhizus]|nr:hypothetical protein G6F22_020213 [Rhizopus arrhizus]